jgi:hypothetical protein
MERKGREGRGEKGANLIASFLFLSSFSDLHAGLSHQGQRPKMVATMHIYVSHCLLENDRHFKASSCPFLMQLIYFKKCNLFSKCNFVWH